MFKFIHTADIHLDSPLRGLARYDGAPVEILRGATRRAFERLVDLAIEEQVAFMVIAGDLYDGDWKDFNTGLYFVRQVTRLAQAGIDVILLYGNHDAESALTRSLPVDKLARVHVLPSGRAGTVVLPHLGVALHGRSFKERDTVENLVPSYPAPLAGHLNIGVLHTALEGHSEHPNYAPTTVAELTNKGYDYWALGHVHAAKVVHERPWIVFPGNLQGRHVRETGKKSATLVTVEDGAIAGLTPLYADVLRWAHVEVDATGQSHRAAVEERVVEALNEAMRTLADGRPLAVRVTVRGTTPAHAELVSDEETFDAHVRALAAGLGTDALWIEKIRLITAAETVTETNPESLSAGMVDEIRALLTGAPADDELKSQLALALRPLAERLPARLRAQLDEGALAALYDGRIDDVLRAATPLVLGRLLGNGAGTDLGHK